MRSPRWKAVTAWRSAEQRCASLRLCPIAHGEACSSCPPVRPLKPVIVVLAAVLAVSGCKTPLKMPFSTSAADDATTRRLASTDDVHGPLERVLLAAGKGNTALPKTSAEGRTRYQAAEKLYKAGKYQEAEKAFAAIAKQYRNTQVQEDALYMTAESQFQRKRYSWAQDSYDRLLKEFPSSRYLDRVSRRKFEIARIWLQFPANIKTGDIQPVNFDDPPHTPAPKSSTKTTWDPSRRIPIFPNLWDRTRPVFDTNHRALEALKSIWVKDPTGPLADDALMMTAGYYVRSGNYAEAARIFSTLRDQYPQSPYLEKAYVIGSQMTLVSHQGPAYDGTSLDKAQKLKAAALRLFPKSADRDRLREELRKIDDAKARQQWANALFWQKKHKPKAVAIYCRRVIDEFPHSQYAALARELLAKVDPQTATAPSAKTAASPPAKTPTPPTRRRPRRFNPFLPRRIEAGQTRDPGQSASPDGPPTNNDSFAPETPSAIDPPFGGGSPQPAEEPPGRVRL